eukprot:3036412-Rhodomonas_salina.1
MLVDATEERQRPGLLGALLGELLGYLQAGFPRRWVVANGRQVDRVVSCGVVEKGAGVELGAWVDLDDQHVLEEDFEASVLPAGAVQLQRQRQKSVLQRCCGRGPSLKPCTHWLEP